MGCVFLCLRVAWLCPLGEGRKGRSDARLWSYAPALCRAADTAGVCSTVCFTFSPDQICMVTELEDGSRATLGTSVLAGQPELAAAASCPRCVIVSSS